MRRICGIFLGFLSIATFAMLAGGQQGGASAAKKSSAVPKSVAPSRERPLVFTEAIPLENAKGRFDHFAIGGGRLFVAALGSNAVEVINVGGRILDHTITGVPNPQGVAFSPEANKLFVASGEGKVYI